MAEKFTPTYDFELFFGPHPEDYFTPSRIAAAEKTYARVVEDKKQDALASMVQMISQMTDKIMQIEPGKPMDEVVNVVYAQAFSIKCNAGIYGYPLATAFANQLFYYCKELIGKPLTRQMQACMRAHLEALRLIFKNDIRSMTDPAALELLKELERLGE